MLLGLPNEIIISILSLCNCKTIAFIGATCRRLRGVTSSTPELVFSTSLAVRGLLDAGTSLELVEKLEQLSDFDSAWADGSKFTVLTQAPSTFTDVEARVSGSCLTAVKSVYNPISTIVDFHPLNSPRHRGPSRRHSTIRIPFLLSDILLDTSQDLVVGVENIDETTSAIHFLSASTGNPYPSARSAADALVPRRLMLRIDIYRHYLHIHSVDLRNLASFYDILDWRAEKDFIVASHTGPSFILGPMRIGNAIIAPGDAAIWLSHPRGRIQNGFEVTCWRGPSPRHFNLALPMLLPGSKIVTAYLEPGPRPHSPSRHEAFIHDEEQLLSYGFQAHNYTEDSTMYSACFIVFIRPKSLLASLLSLPESGDRATIPWDAWSEHALLVPNVYARFSLPLNTMRAITQLNGQSLLVLDFHPRRVPQRCASSVDRLEGLLSMPEFPHIARPRQRMFVDVPATTTVLGGLKFSIAVLDLSIVSSIGQRAVFCDATQDAVVMREPNGDHFLCAVSLPERDKSSPSPASRYNC